MRQSPLKSSAGFTYIATLVMVVIVGIMLSQAAQYWSMSMQREREEELLFRGTQVRDALRRWYNFKLPAAGAPQVAAATAQPGVPQRGNLPDLKTLVNGASSAAKEHFLRPSNLTVRDPATGKELEWTPYKDPSTQKITGVYIKSDGVPIKQDNFPLDLHPDDFKAKKKYSDWLFIYNRVPPSTSSGGTQNLPGATAVPGNAPK